MQESRRLFARIEALMANRIGYYSTKAERLNIKLALVMLIGKIIKFVIYLRAILAA